MSSLVSSKNRELNRGYSPAPIPASQNVWPMIALVAALLVTQIPVFGNLIACLVCLSGMAYIFRLEAKLLLPSPPKPFVSAEKRITANCFSVDFGGSPMLLFKIATFECSDTRFNTPANRTEWLERFAAGCGRRVLAVSTTRGIRHTARVEDSRHNLMLVSLAPGDEDSACAHHYMELLSELGVVVLDASEELLDTSMGHKWWLGHYYGTNLHMALSTSEMMDEISLLLTENNGTYSDGFTVISTIEANHLKTYRTEIAVAMDLFLYSYKAPPNVSSKLNVPVALTPNERDNIIRGTTEGESIFRKANRRPWLPRFQLARREKMRFGAIFVNKPMSYFYRFFWDHSALAIGEQSKPRQIGKDHD